MRRRGSWTAALLAGALLAAAGCSGGDAEKAAPTSKGPVTWPKYWEAQESTAAYTQSTYGAAYGVAIDGDIAVYNGPDIIRGIDKATGKQRWQRKFTKSGICAVQTSGTVVGHRFITGHVKDGLSSEGGKCTGIVATDSRTGKEAFQIADKAARDISIAVQGERVLMTSTFTSYAQRFVSVDLATGKIVWQKRSAELLPPDPKDKDSSGCATSSGVAKNEPVIILAGTCLSGDDATVTVVGVDLNTGKTLWSKPYWDPAATTVDPDSDEWYALDPEDLAPSPIDGRLWLPIADRPGKDKGERGRKGTKGAWVDAKTGTVTPIPMPTAVVGKDALPGVLDQIEAATETGGSDGVQGTSAWPAADGMVVFSTYSRTQYKRRLVGYDIAKSAVRWQWEGKARARGHDYMTLGLTSDAKEFWISDDEATVHRIDIASGKVVARGRLDPAINIPQEAYVTPDAILVKQTLGDGKELHRGLALYQWRAPVSSATGTASPTSSTTP